MEEDNKSFLPGHVDQDLAHQPSWPVTTIAKQAATGIQQSANSLHSNSAFTHLKAGNSFFFSSSALIPYFMAEKERAKERRGRMVRGGDKKEGSLETAAGEAKAVSRFRRLSM
ncbi:unnamed protein product [Pleuronectes platessa]|uniref:Uncharacterized protein n=1 Tax=Pleuronectes platessa TaxID=8262 RepID=A0A9N7YJJ2_PLEPL|nr:unnamed protein product [Pleuronectes platessa]